MSTTSRQDTFMNKKKKRIAFSGYQQVKKNIENNHGNQKQSREKSRSWARIHTKLISLMIANRYRKTNITQHSHNFWSGKWSDRFRKRRRKPACLPCTKDSNVPASKVNNECFPHLYLSAMFKRRMIPKKAKNTSNKKDEYEIQ